MLHVWVTFRRFAAVPFLFLCSKCDENKPLFFVAACVIKESSRQLYATDFSEFTLVLSVKIFEIYVKDVQIRQTFRKLVMSFLDVLRHFK